MEMVKMLKIRIYPDEKDKSLLIDSMHAYVAGCNYVSEYVFTSENLSAVSVQKEIYHQIRKAFSLPAQMVSSAMSVGKSLHRYFTHQISGAECMSEMAQDGVGTIGSVMCSTIGIAAIPAAAPAVVGVMVGVGAAMIGYTLATAAYKEIMSAMNAASYARSERIRIERECEESIRMIRQYRREMEEQVDRYLSEHKKAFESCFMTLDDAILHDDVDGFIRGNAEFQGILGGKSQFSSFDEFDRLMGSGEELVF